jgi:hypothetical protein
MPELDRAIENLIEGDKHRDLYHHGQAAADGIDLLFAVEAHHLFVELLPVVLVLLLQLPDLGLKPLHLDHRPGALHRQRGGEEHHHQREQRDRDGVVGYQLEEEVERRRDQVEQAI